MRGANIAGIVLVVVLAVALADLVAPQNVQGTKTLANAGVSLEKAALNAELGKSS